MFPMKWKNYVFYFVKTQMAPNVLWGLKKQIYFSTLNVGKKVSSFWGINCMYLTAWWIVRQVTQTKLSKSLFSCTYYQTYGFLNVYSIVLHNDRFVLKLIPWWDLAFKTLILPKPTNYTCLQKKHLLTFCIST